MRENWRLFINKSYWIILKKNVTKSKTKVEKQAGAELGQAQLPTGIGLYCD